MPVYQQDILGYVWLALGTLALLVAEFQLGLRKARVEASRALAKRRRSPPDLSAAPRFDVIVPLKGDFEVGLIDHAAVVARTAGATLTLVVEEESDVEASMLRAWKEGGEWPHVQIIYSGRCPEGVNGKVHNLLAGVRATSGEVLCFKDADVKLTHELLAWAHHLLAYPNTGAVFAPPFYREPEGLGAALLAGYTNYLFASTMARADEKAKLSYCAGAFYAIRRERYTVLGGFNDLLHVVSDDAYLGRKVVEAGLAIRLIPAIATMPSHPIALRVAIDHLRRWTLLGRIFDQRAFRRTAINSASMGVVVAFGCWTAFGWSVEWYVLGVLWVFVAARLIDNIWDNHRAFVGVRPTVPEFLGAFLVDLLQPFFWLDAALARKMVWRGRTYRLDANGQIVGSQNQQEEA